MAELLDYINAMHPVALAILVTLAIPPLLVLSCCVALVVVYLFVFGVSVVCLLGGLTLVAVINLWEACGRWWRIWTRV